MRSTITPDLTVLVPIYNEEEGLSGCVAQLHEYLRGQPYSYEILLVDDHSTDASPEVAQALCAADPQVRYHRHERNYGPCSALRTGPPLAKGRWTLLVPVDLAIPLEDIARFWENREKADIVLGYIRDGQARALPRRVQSRIYTFLVRALFGYSWPQINYVALYRTATVQALRLDSTGVALHAEILVRAADAGAVVRPIPVGYEPRTTGVARGARPSVILGTVAEILRLWWSLRGRRALFGRRFSRG